MGVIGAIGGEIRIFAGRARKGAGEIFQCFFSVFSGANSLIGAEVNNDACTLNTLGTVQYASNASHSVSWRFDACCTWRSEPDRAVCQPVQHNYSQRAGCDLRFEQRVRRSFEVVGVHGGGFHSSAGG